MKLLAYLETHLPDPTEAPTTKNNAAEKRTAQHQEQLPKLTVNSTETETTVDVQHTIALQILTSNNNKENIENLSAMVNKQNSQPLDDDFSKAFTMPIKYLPQKKKIKLESSGKPKLPAAGTSDAWLKMQLEKEEKKRLKEEQIAKKKELQKQKKLLAEEKKKIDAKMKEEKKKVEQQMLEITRRIIKQEKN